MIKKNVQNLKSVIVDHMAQIIQDLHKTQQKDTLQVLRFYLNSKNIIQQRKLLNYLI